MKWYCYYNRFLAFHCQFDYWLSFGIHIDFKKRLNANQNKNYGPYIDIHFLNCIISIGNNPIYSTAYHASIFRAGEAE